MKTVRKILLGCVLTIACRQPVLAQSQEAQQLLLNVTKLAQLKTTLSDLKKGYRILYNGYTAIKNVSKGSFDIHDAFLNSLLQVSPAVKHYKKVADVISLQFTLLTEYKAAYRRFQQSGQFTPNESDYVAKVYANLFDASVKNLEALATVLTGGKLRMSDDERLKAIDGIHEDLEDMVIFLRQFNDKTKLLALQRLKENRDVETAKRLYGIR